MVNIQSVMTWLFPALYYRAGKKPDHPDHYSHFSVYHLVKLTFKYELHDRASNMKIQWCTTDFVVFRTAIVHPAYGLKYL